MKQIVFFLLACLGLLSCREQQPVRIHILGDSTTEQQNQNLKDQRGWPQMLPHFFNDRVTVLNHGKSGTSSRTFYEEKWWANAKAAIRPGDYVVIQFGHNDEKHQGFDGPVGTVASGTYREYLQKFVDEIRALEAIPIFATPIVRKMGDPGEPVSRRSAHDLAEYVAANVDPAVDPADTVTFNYPHNMRQVAEANGCPLIDMTASTRALVDRIGFEAATRRIYNFGDGTHICAEGALLFSKLFVDELKGKGILAGYIVADPALVVQPAAVDFGEVFIGAEARQEIDLIVPTEMPIFTGFRVEAGEGALVSDREFGEYTDAITLEAEYDLLYYRRLYVKVNPAAEGTLDSRVRVTAAGETREVPVRAVSLPYPAGAPVSVSYSLNGNPKPEARGPVQAVEHTFSGLERSSFDALGAEGIGAHLDPPVTSRAEWLTVPGKNWPEGEIDVVSTRYAQFGVTAAPGTTLRLERITLYAGGGVNYRIQVSTDPSFAAYTVLGEGGERLLTGYALPVNRSLKAGETLYLRVYPWAGSDPQAQLCLSRVSFEGQVTVAEKP